MLRKKAKTHKGLSSPSGACIRENGYMVIKMPRVNEYSYRTSKERDLRIHKDTISRHTVERSSTYEEVTIMILFDIYFTSCSSREEEAHPPVVFGAENNFNMSYSIVIIKLVIH